MWHGKYEWIWPTKQMWSLSSLTLTQAQAVHSTVRVVDRTKDQMVTMQGHSTMALESAVST